MYCYFSPQAERDLEEIGDYIAQDNPQRALSFIEELRARCQKLCGFARAFPVRLDLGKEIRVMPADNYIICYIAQEDRIIIERVFNAARDVNLLF